ncbi:hypothetical protein FKM82_012150, partial [Ascaphus truei]
MMLLLLYLGLVPFRGEGFQQKPIPSDYNITIPREIPTPLYRKEVAYIIEIEGVGHIIRLKKHLPIHAEDDTSKIQLQRDCFYVGIIVDIEHSYVSLSMCQGMRGLVATSSTKYQIEPLESSLEDEHIIYPLKQPYNNSLLLPESYVLLWSRSLQKLSVFLETFRTTLFYEIVKTLHIFIVISNGLSRSIGGDANAITDAFINMCGNELRSMFMPFSVVVLVKEVEVWNETDMINTDGQADDILARFLHWRMADLIIRKPHDLAYLLVHRDVNTPAGKTAFGEVCSITAAGVIFYPLTLAKISEFAPVLAHFLGHNLGMKHDNHRNCECAGITCIMDSKQYFKAHTFSSCSDTDIQSFFWTEKSFCLNYNRVEPNVRKAVCGNYYIEKGEKCDCGMYMDCSDHDECCTSTCTVKEFFTCAVGECCDKCKISKKGTVCRASVNECDLPEYCDGISNYCPPDVFLQNGSPCNKGTAYCYGGKCPEMNRQC